MAESRQIYNHSRLFTSKIEAKLPFPVGTFHLPTSMDSAKQELVKAQLGRGGWISSFLVLGFVIYSL